MFVGLGILVVGVVMLVGGNVIVAAMHLTARDVAYAWLVFPGFTVTLFGGLLFFFSMVATA